MEYLLKDVTHPFPFIDDEKFSDKEVSSETNPTLAQEIVTEKIEIHETAKENKKKKKSKQEPENN